MGTDIIGMEKLVEKIKGDKYSLKILRELNRNPRGLLCHDLMIKLGFKGRGHFYKKLNDLESKPPLITREKMGRDVNVVITWRGKMILSKVEAESKERLPEIIKNQYGFYVGAEGKCNATFYLPFGSVDARQHIANEMAPSIERLTERLLKKSVHVLEKGEKLQAWILVDLETDEVNESIFDFREDLFELKKDMDRIQNLWDAERWGPLKESQVAMYLYRDDFFFEAVLVREELKERNVDISSFPKFIEVKWPVLSEDFKTCVARNTIAHYKPDFRFLINNEVVDLSDTTKVRIFLSSLEEPDIKEWIKRNRDKDGMDQWFEGIPWDDLGFPANEDTDLEFIEEGEDEEEESRYLFYCEEPEPILSSYLRFMFHVLKRTPVEVGTEKFFADLKFYKQGIERGIDIPDLSDQMFLQTFEKVKNELNRDDLPIDLKNRVYAPIAPQDYLGLSFSIIYDYIKAERIRENTLIDKFMKTMFENWDSQKPRHECWKSHIIVDWIEKIEANYRAFISKGLKPEDALIRAVDETTPAGGISFPST